MVGLLWGSNLLETNVYIIPINIYSSCNRSNCIFIQYVFTCWLVYPQLSVNVSEACVMMSQQINLAGWSWGAGLTERSYSLPCLDRRYTNNFCLFSPTGSECGGGWGTCGRGVLSLSHDPGTSQVRGGAGSSKGVAGAPEQPTLITHWWWTHHPDCKCFLLVCVCWFVSWQRQFITMSCVFPCQSWWNLMKHVHHSWFQLQIP